MKKLLLSTFIVSQLLSFKGHAIDPEMEARMTKSKTSVGISEKNNEIFNAYEFVSTQQKINPDFIEKYKDYSTIRLQLPSHNTMDLKEIGAYLAPLVIKGSGLNFETLDLSFNNWQANQTAEFLESLRKNKKIEQERISGPSYTGTFEEYEKEQNTFFSMLKAFAAFSGQSGADVPSTSNDEIVERYKKASQPTFIEKTVYVDGDLTLKNINLSHNLIFDRSNLEDFEDIKLDKLCNILVHHEFESVNLSHNIKDFWELNSNDPNAILAGVLLDVEDKLKKTGYSEKITFYNKEAKYLDSLIEALSSSVKQYKKSSTVKTDEKKLYLKNLDLSSNNIKNLVRNVRGGYGSRTPTKRSYLSDLAKISNIEILNLSDNPVLSNDLEKHTQDDFKTTNIGKILISSHTLSEDLKVKLSDPSLQSKWVIKD